MIISITMAVCLVCNTRDVITNIKASTCIKCIPRYVKIIQITDADCETLMQIWRAAQNICHICHDSLAGPARLWLWTRAGDLAVCTHGCGTQSEHNIFTKQYNGCSKCGCYIGLYEMLAVTLPDNAEKYKERVCIECINKLIPNHAYKGHNSTCAQCGSRGETTWSAVRNAWQCNVCAIANMTLD